ncbi:PA14 domain protein [Planctomycetes bacterium CA13]|uniref:PA14 domain protein n=1 Tax=Novipirellula herctigrandis TaxID=2527986 RepID=A0A5C5Z3D8_9BACT|nr:PA14 domain protein [Planctomycetes bacterium CA13]
MLLPSARPLFSLSSTLLLALILIPSYSVCAEDTEFGLGTKIYSQGCAECHGEQGEGVQSEYAAALIGDASIGELAEVISDTMPEQDPDLCVGEDAVAVARYIHHAFYGEAARLRNRPPKLALARLTGEQLRQSLADLYGSFAGNTWAHEDHGVNAIYFDGDRWNDKKRKIERVDSVIDFDFGHDSPGEGIEPESFYIHWTGTLKADRTGDYELVLRSTCSCTLDFGHTQRKLIDNHVQSEGRTEFRKRIRLTAGRGYPFELSFIQRERKTDQPPALVSFCWVPPGGVEEVIPQRNLLATSFPPAFSLQTKLPPDDSSYGYERGTQISRIWDDSTTQAAVEFSQFAGDELWPLYQQKHKKDSNENRAKLRTFLGELAETAFRGSLDEIARKLYIDEQVDATEDDREAIRRVCLLALKSPRFLYPTLDSNQTASRRVANRLALVLYDSLPVDDWLLAKIQKDELATEAQANQTAWSMVSDYRTQGKMRSFLYHWFHVGGTDEIPKDSEAYPGFDQAVVSDLRASFNAFVDEVVWSETSDFRQFFIADWTFTTDRLATFYGDAWKPVEAEGPPLRRSVSDAKVRMGVLNHPLVMSSLSYYKTTSPIHRGVFLNRYILGRTLRPPNAAFAPLNPDLHPQLTTRERVSLQTEDVNCQVCHERINALGFTLENFDAVGRWRETENDRPVNASGNYLTRDSKTVTFEGASDLANYLAKSDDCHKAFVEAAFEYFVKQPVTAYGSDTLDRLTDKFRNSGFKVRDLLVAIAATAATEPLKTQEEA